MLHSAKVTAAQETARKCGKARPCLAGLTAAALLLCLSGGTVEAQTVTSGDRLRAHFTGIRLTQTGGRTQPDTVDRFIEGNLVSWDSTGLALQLSASDKTVSDTFMAWPDVTSLELYAGRKSRMGTGALVGGLAGLAIGGVIAIASCPCEASTGQVVGVVGLVFAGSGALLGGLIGAASPSDRWTEVPLEPGTIALAPADAAADRVDHPPEEVLAADAPGDEALTTAARQQKPASERQLGADFLYFSGMGSGPGVEASFAITSGSGFRLGLGGELYFGGTEQSGDAEVDWSATGLFGEFGYRFSSTGWMPYAGIRPEILWARSETTYEYEGEQITEPWTESDLALGVLAGVEKRLGSSFAASFTGIAVISFDEGSKHRYGIRLGGRYLF